ncbi:MAG: hypothetical protein DHS20C13_01760 [Thermodesulfobacteriota bacterium]|nr:MAG: hypothetical protein DHS20C13_01760 [Thermodesulfobacteriota bacterium]
MIPLFPALSQVISPIRKSGRNSNIVVFLFIILSIITNKQEGIREAKILVDMDDNIV